MSHLFSLLCALDLIITFVMCICIMSKLHERGTHQFEENILCLRVSVFHGANAKEDRVKKFRVLSPSGDWERGLFVLWD